MKPNIPLGARHHYTTLKIETNQSRRRPTSQSLSKLPISSLYLQLLSRGRTFPLASLETDGLIIGKSREKVESLSLLSSSLLFSILSFPLPTELFGLKSKVESLSQLSSSLLFSILSFPLPTELFGLKSSGMSSLATCHPPIGSLGLSLSPYPSTLDFSPIICCHMSLMAPTLALCLTYPALNTWHSMNHSSCAKCPVLPSVPRKT